MFGKKETTVATRVKKRYTATRKLRMRWHINTHLDRKMDGTLNGMATQDLMEALQVSRTALECNTVDEMTFSNLNPFITK